MGWAMGSEQAISANAIRAIRERRIRNSPWGTEPQQRRQIWPFCDSGGGCKGHICAEADSGTMKQTAAPRVESPMSDPLNVSTRLGRGGWIVIVVLLAFLVAAIAYAVHGWN